MRQALHQARVLGARHHHVIRVIMTGLRAQSMVPEMLEAVAAAVGDVLISSG